MSESILTSTRPCIKCGACDRLPNGKCRPCKNAANRRRYEANPSKAIKAAQLWNASNPEKVKKAGAKRYAKNAEKLKAAGSSWYYSNKEKARVAQAAWQSANRNRRRIYYNNRQARKASAGGSLSKGLIAKLYLLQRGRCPCCGLPLGDDFHLDHKTPIALGGANEDSNMQLLRAKCNLEKHAKHPVDFMQERGFLL